MKKINSIHYGGRILLMIGIIGVILPCVFWILSIFLNNNMFLFARNLFFIIGLLFSFIFFLYLLIEFHQDKKIEIYYATHKKMKIHIKDGRYECYKCGNRMVAETDSYCKVCGVIFEKYDDKKPQEILDRKR